jgi:predicted transcriptional regulator
MSPNYEGTTIRSIRIPDELWDLAQAIAVDRGETVSAVIRRSLIDYVEHYTATSKSTGGTP